MDIGSEQLQISKCWVLKAIPSEYFSVFVHMLLLPRGVTLKHSGLKCLSLCRSNKNKASQTFVACLHSKELGYEILMVFNIRNANAW